MASDRARADVLTVTASGTVATSCSIAKATGGDFASPNLAASGSVTGKATVVCNTAFKIAATSANAALKNPKTAPANFTNSVPYTFAMAVKVDDGSTVSATTPSTPCPSSGMTSATGCVLSATGKTAVGTGGAGQAADLTLTYTVPSLPTRLIAGTYSDTVTLSIATLP